MNPEWVKEFVKLVKSGAPIKAYQKRLGLNKEGLQYHLGRLVEYEESLSSPKPEVPTISDLRDRKKTAKVKKTMKKISDIREAFIKKADEEKAVEEDKDETGETS